MLRDHEKQLSEPRRHLATIMFTDMVGYTALGQKDEELSLTLIQENNKFFVQSFTTRGNNSEDDGRCIFGTISRCPKWSEMWI